MLWRRFWARSPAFRMGRAVLVGVNPVYGLYGGTAGPVGGRLGGFARARVRHGTTASVFAAGSARGRFSRADRPEALFMLSVLAGVMMIAVGCCAEGAPAVVSVSVLTGWLGGVALNPSSVLAYDAAPGGASGVENRGGYTSGPIPSSGSPAARGAKRLSSELTLKRGPSSTWPSRTSV
jgi:hypothetical protein